MNPEKQPLDSEIAETLSDEILFSKSDMGELQTISAEVCTDQIEGATLSPKTIISNGIIQLTKINLKLLDRFNVIKILGQGAFGTVYLATDEKLNRQVAIKVSKTKQKDEVVQSFLKEAQMLATLDHQNIVPIYDVGHSDKEGFFIISKFLEGGNLANEIKNGIFDVTRICNIVSSIASGLNHAHLRGLVHRDIKPENILLDNVGNPFIGDFGLALSEEGFGKGHGLLGTPKYMSPEQANGEGHRVDGRSDIFSLGIIFYEMITQKHPFIAGSVVALLQQIKRVEVKPPRQINSSIPVEIERICLKALSKKVVDRYTIAADMVEDINIFLSSGEQSSIILKRSNFFGVDSKSIRSKGMETKIPKVVYKGLRSFDQNDSEFFLELLSGSKDRNGLPQILRFWKNQIENFTPTFLVGVIYGPSGCGKSSLVKAGLFPNLDPCIIPIYLEATPNHTEESILRSFRRQFPDLSEKLGITEAFSCIRKLNPAGANKKILLVVDQFEQWLHSNSDFDESPLVNAFRQVNGEHLQVILMVRDDFILGINRLMSFMEIPIMEGNNFTMVDLFDHKHGRKVLRIFGKALEALPEGDISHEQEQFVHESIEALSTGGKIIPVRIAVFADMMKNYPWQVQSLSKIGGIDGVGVQFLEEIFLSSSAPVLCKLHFKAAQKIMKALLPHNEAGIKGNTIPYDKLLAISSYENQPKEFEQLIQMLDGELKLINPIFSEGNNSDNIRSYQLAHDYLVPSLREWLEKKQKETKRGRSELLLEDFSQLWNSKPRSSQIPSFFQYLQICWHTMGNNKSHLQKKMLNYAFDYYSKRTIITTLFLFGMIISGVLIQNHLSEKGKEIEAGGFVKLILDANTPLVPKILADTKSHKKWMDRLLLNEAFSQDLNYQQKLNMSMALLDFDKKQIDYLLDRLLDAEPNQIFPICQVLLPHKEIFLNSLWDKLGVLKKETQHLRVAASLAIFDPESSNWPNIASKVAMEIIDTPPVYLSIWMELFKPVKIKLISPLTSIFSNPALVKNERYISADILAEYTEDNSIVLADLLMNSDLRQYSDSRQYEVIFLKIKPDFAKVASMFIAEIENKAESNTNEEHKEKASNRKANAAVTLLERGYMENFWPMLKEAPDPRTRSLILERLKTLGIDPQVILNRLKLEQDISIKRALAFSLIEFSPESMDKIIFWLREEFLKEPDSGFHAAVELLLKKHGEDSWVKTSQSNLAKNPEERARIILNIINKPKPSSPQWFVNSIGQTMVGMAGPIEFVMGSPLIEKGRYSDEMQHKKRIDRSFAISSKHVTMEEFKLFAKDYEPSDHYKIPNLPAIEINWASAAQYCNWLSKNEGIPEEQWCYLIEENEIFLKPNYLSLNGYRLPTEAEMEYATRAGTSTARFFGETEELLEKHAWFLNNSQDKLWPVGSLKPNGFGFFDVYGNVSGWCQNVYSDYQVKTPNDKEGDLKLFEGEALVLRGGTRFDPGKHLRSAIRIYDIPSKKSSGFSFRVAKTLSPR